MLFPATSQDRQIGIFDRATESIAARSVLKMSPGCSCHKRGREIIKTRVQNPAHQVSILSRSESLFVAVLDCCVPCSNDLAVQRRLEHSGLVSEG